MAGSSGWCTLDELAHDVAAVLGDTAPAFEDAAQRAALVADCLASDGVVAMPTQAHVGLNLKGSLLAHREDVADGVNNVSAAASWRYSPQAAALLRAYVAAVPALAVAVHERLFSAGGALQASKFVLGLPFEALTAAVAWRAAHLPAELLARDSASGGRADAWRPPPAAAPVPVAAPRASAGLHWRAQPPPQQQQQQQSPPAAGDARRRVLRAGGRAAACADAPRHTKPPLTAGAPAAAPRGAVASAPTVLVPAAAPEKPAWGGASGAPAAPRGPLRSILAEEEQRAAQQQRAAVAAQAARAAAAAAFPAANAPKGAAPQPQQQGGAALRVLRPGDALPAAAAWVRVAAAPPPTSSQGALRAPPTASAALPPPSTPADVAAQARRSTPDAGGRVRCLACGKAFGGHVPLAQHLSSSHFGVNSADAAEVEAARQAAGLRGPVKARHAPLLLSDLLDSAAAVTPGPQGTRTAAASSALANTLFMYVKEAKQRKDASRAGVALGFQARPRAGGERMLNPNSASSAAVVVRRGKERVGGKKKRVSTLKKIILRERAATAAARAASAQPPPPAQGGADAAAAHEGDADAEVVLHLERGRVYVRVADSAAEGARVHMLVVEAADSDDGSDADDSSNSSAGSEPAGDGVEAEASSSAEECDEEETSTSSSDDEGEELTSACAAAADASAAAAAAAAPPSAAAAATLRAAAVPFVPQAAQAAAAAAEVHVCALCGTSTIGAASAAQHVAGRRHLSKVAAAAAASAKAAAGENGAAAASAPAAAPHTYLGPDAALRYGRQVLSRELNVAVSAMLQRLLELQARTRATDPLRAKAKRRVVFGLREAAKAVRTRKAKLLLVAPNVEAVAAPGGLDDALAELLDAAAGAGVPVVLALTRSRLGALTGRRVRMSAAAVLDASGAEGSFADVARMAAEGRAAWRAAHPDAPPEPAPAPPSAGAEAFVRLRRDGRTRALLPGEVPGLLAGGDVPGGRSCIVACR